MLAGGTEYDAGALLHELLDGYESPAQVAEEVRELQVKIKDLSSDLDALTVIAKDAAKRIASARATLEKVRAVCADETRLNEVIAVLEEIDLG